VGGPDGKTIEAVYSSAEENNWNLIFPGLDADNPFLAVVNQGASVILTDHDFAGQHLQQASAFPNVYFILVLLCQISSA
jgi:hypothetical protein